SHYNYAQGVAGGLGSGSGPNVRDDSGAALPLNTATVTWTSSNGAVGENPIQVTDGDTALMKSFLENTSTNLTPIVMHAQSPYAEYDIYLFTDGDNRFNGVAETRRADYMLLVGPNTTATATAVD